jgi:hypothetical protein
LLTIVSFSVSYGSARLKLKEAEETSDLSDNPKGKRNRRPVCRFDPTNVYQTDSSSSESESVTKRKKNGNSMQTASSRSPLHPADSLHAVLPTPPSPSHEASQIIPYKSQFRENSTVLTLHENK